MFVAAAGELEAMFSLWVQCASRRRLRPHSQFSRSRYRRQLGSTGADSGNLQHSTHDLAVLRFARRQEGVSRIRSSSNPVFNAGLSAALVCTGPAGTQRLRRWRADSGAGAEYAPTPFPVSTPPSHAYKLLRHAVARLRDQARQERQGSYPSTAPTPSALPNRVARSC